jgi:hypothetical protein
MRIFFPILHPENQGSPYNQAQSWTCPKQVFSWKFKIVNEGLLHSGNCGICQLWYMSCTCLELWIGAVLTAVQIWTKHLSVTVFSGEKQFSLWYLVLTQLFTYLLFGRPTWKIQNFHCFVVLFSWHILMLSHDCYCPAFFVLSLQSFEKWWL